MKDSLNTAVENVAKSILLTATQRILVLLAVPASLMMVGWIASRFNDMQLDVAVIKMRVDGQYIELVRKNNEQDTKIAQILDFIMLNSKTRIQQQ